MTTTGWQFHIREHPLRQGQELFIGFDERYPVRKRMVVKPLEGVALDPMAVYDTPTLSESQADREDGLGDVTNFLQEALECAWGLGMRPRGYGDVAGELKATKYHLEDMRALAKVPARG